MQTDTNKRSFHLIVLLRKPIIHKNILKSNISDVMRVSVKRSKCHDMKSNGISLGPDLPTYAAAL